jgi:hypothetical protein
MHDSIHECFLEALSWIRLTGSEERRMIGNWLNRTQVNIEGNRVDNHGEHLEEEEDTLLLEWVADYTTSSREEQSPWDIVRPQRIHSSGYHHHLDEGTHG